jgi:vesicle transport protein SEC22
MVRLIVIDEDEITRRMKMRLRQPYNNMTLFVIISRLSDSLPLVASTDSPNDGNLANIEQYKSQARSIIKKLNSRSPSKMSIESGGFCYNYIIEDSIVYLIMTPGSYPRQLAFDFLSELKLKFIDEVKKESGVNDYFNTINTVSRPYTFLKFDRVIQILKKDYSDVNTKQNQSRLQSDLNDIQHIMRKNIQEVLDRGEKLDLVAKASSKLTEDSKKFKWGAKKLNLMDAWKNYLVPVLAVIVILLVIYWRFF